jgi:hypothetical protein
LKNIGLNEELNFIHFNHDMFIRMCVLSGCDYLDSLQGIGIVNAYKIVRDYKTLDGIFEQLEKVVTLPKDYKKDFLKAELTFKHQRVFDVLNRKMVPLNPLPEEISEEPLSFLGPLLSSSVYLSICTGKMDPITMKYFDEEKSTTHSGVVSKTSPFMNQSTLKIGISKKQSINTLLIKKYLKSDEESLTSFDSQKSSFDSQNKESGSEESEEGEESGSGSEESEQESEYEEEEEEQSEREPEREESEPQKEQIEISDDSDQEKKKRKHETIINLTNEKRDLFDMIYKKKKINK